MSRPLRLSGRRRQATSPHAANDPPTQAVDDLAASTGVVARKMTGTSAPNSAATDRGPHRDPEPQAALGSREL